MALVTVFGEVIQNKGRFAQCCGSAYLTGLKTTPARKWSNQHGFGITPAKPADVCSNIKKGIVLLEGKVGESISNYNYEVKHVKTKNGIVTIGVKKVW